MNPALLPEECFDKRVVQGILTHKRLYDLTFWIDEDLCGEAKNTVFFQNITVVGTEDMLPVQAITLYCLSPVFICITATDTYNLVFTGIFLVHPTFRVMRQSCSA